MDIKIVRKQIQLLWRGVDGQGMCTKIVSALYFFLNMYPISYKNTLTNQKQRQKIVRKQIQLLWRGVDGQGMCTKIVSAFYFFPNLYPISYKKNFD